VPKPERFSVGDVGHSIGASQTFFNSFPEARHKWTSHVFLRIAQLRLPSIPEDDSLGPTVVPTECRTRYLEWMRLTAEFVIPPLDQ
jgi:hypothetical protein